MTLTEFLLARIEEDEAAQNEPHSDLALHTNDCAIHPQGMEDTWCDCDAPARVQEECDAKRKIIEIYEGARNALSILETVETADSDRYGTIIVKSCLSTVDAVLRIHAEVHADHEDYDPSWRP